MSRLPRFKRASEIPPFELTDRDREIIRLVNRHRYLRSSHIVALAGGSGQQLLRRLQLLYHHRYLERPRAQLDYYHRGGSREIVYCIGYRGAKLLERETGAKVIWPRHEEKDGSVQRPYLEHALLVSDAMAAIELACRNHGGIRFLHGSEIHSDELKKEKSPFKWHVQVFGKVKLGVMPDRVFAFDFGNGQRSLFFLEADRGTMPVERKNLSQTSFYRKLLGYESTWLQRIHEKRFGFNRFRVLTVTTIAGRVNSLVEACSQLKRGRGLFLFAHKDILENFSDLLSAPQWQTATPGKTESLMG